jgi:hypothetical protein
MKAMGTRYEGAAHIPPIGGCGKGWHQVCCRRAGDSKNVLMKDTIWRAIAPVV